MCQMGCLKLNIIDCTFNNVFSSKCTLFYFIHGTNIVLVCATAVCQYCEELK